MMEFFGITSWIWLSVIAFFLCYIVFIATKTHEFEDQQSCDERSAAFAAQVVEEKRQREINVKRYQEVQIILMKYISNFRIGDLVEYGQIHDKNLAPILTNIFKNVSYYHPPLLGCIGVVVNIKSDNSGAAILSVSIPDRGVIETDAWQWAIIGRSVNEMHKNW